MVYHTMVYHGKPWYIIPVYHGIPWYRCTMVYHGTPLYTMVIPWYTMLTLRYSWGVNSAKIHNYPLVFFSEHAKVGSWWQRRKVCDDSHLGTSGDDLCLLSTVWCEIMNRYCYLRCGTHHTDISHTMRLSSVWPINFQYHIQAAATGYSCVGYYVKRAVRFAVA